MKKLLALTMLFTLLAGCTQQRRKDQVEPVSTALYEKAVRQNSINVKPISRTRKQSNFIKKTMNPLCRELAATEEGCDGYKEYLEQAETLHQKSVQVLGPSDPQVYRPYRFIFKKACQCGDTKNADKAAHELIAIQTKLFGVQNTDVSAVVAELADFYFNRNEPQKALALVDAQLSQLGNLARAGRQIQHGAYHLLLVKIKAEDALMRPEATIRTCALAVRTRERFITGQCWDMSRGFAEAHVASAKAQMGDYPKAVLLLEDALKKKSQPAAETDVICKVGTRIGNQLASSGEYKLARKLTDAMAHTVESNSVKAPTKQAFQALLQRLAVQGRETS